MNISAILLNGLWAAIFATGFGILLTAPARYLVATFLSGFAGCVVRDVLMGSGLSQNWSTVAAAAALVLLAAAITRRPAVPPVVLICGILPLGAAAAVFNMIFELMNVSSMKGDALSAATVALISNTGKAFTGTLAVALGLAMGVAFMKLLNREAADGV